MKSIGSKILVLTLLLVLSALLVCSVISYVTLDGMESLTERNFEKTEELTVSESSDMLIGLTTSQAEAIAKSCSQTVDSKVDNMLDLLKVVSECISDIYSDPDDYEPHPYLHPLESKAEEYCMQLVMAENVPLEGDVEEEAYLLGNMEYIFRSVIENQSNILSIYFTSETGINMGYDNTPQTKPMYYDGRNASWYTYAMEGKAAVTEEDDDDDHDDEDGSAPKSLSNDRIYISEAYDDSFGRGKMVTVAVPCRDRSGELRGVCGMDILITDLEKLIRDVNTMESSYVVLTSRDGIVCSQAGRAEEAERVLNSPVAAGETVLEKMFEQNGGVTDVSVGGEDIYVAYHSPEFADWMVALIIPKDKILEPSEKMNSLLKETMNAAKSDENAMVNRAVFLWILSVTVIALLSVLSAFSLSRKISSPIIKLSKDAERVGTGDLDYKSDIHTEDEIGKLSRNFESMTVSLKEYIENYTRVTAEKEHISAELGVARQIQADMLPTIFPPFPERTEFDIYASMTPAKEVGGDFYDFFFIDEDHLALVIADVSGKGVPASLFMVIAKTMIKDKAMNGIYSPSEILADVNNRLCEGNEADMFVTVWLAVIDVSTGKGLVANAGHENPALCRSGEKFEIIKYKHSPAVAMMEGMRFKEHEIELFPGDTLFVYTDGVPEATNADSVLFGEDRLWEALQGVSDADATTILTTVKSAVDEFVGDAPQFDDLTMLGFKYFGRKDPV